jgi:hypothetical protein
VIARDHQPAAEAAKARYPAAVFRRESIASVHREQPKLVEIALVQFRQHRIGGTWRIAIARRHFEQSSSVAVALGTQKRGQPAETRDRPVVRRGRNGRLQQDPYRAIYRLVLGVVLDGVIDSSERPAKERRT